MISLAGGDRLRILDWDIENRPLDYAGPDWTNGEITAIAWGWTDQKKIHVRALGEVDAVTMLTDFRKAWDQADIVTGHWITGHDLPITNGAMLENGLPPLDAKLVSDTKAHLIKRRYISASQENLSEMLGVEAQKFSMNSIKWRAANRLTPAGIKLTKRRVMDDVRQHKQLRAKLIELGALKSPKMWRP